MRVENWESAFIHPIEERKKTPTRRLFPENFPSGVMPRLWPSSRPPPEGDEGDEVYGASEIERVCSEVSPLNRYGSTVAKFLTVHRFEKVV